MSYYYDKPCNRILTSRSGVHGTKKHGYDWATNCPDVVFLGHAYWKGFQRDPEAVRKIIQKLEETTGRKATEDEKEFIKSI